MSDISPKGDILYFDALLWSLDTYKKIKTIGEEHEPETMFFSNDNQYFMTSEHRFGVAITRINDKTESILFNSLANNLLALRSE